MPEHPHHACACTEHSQTVHKIGQDKGGQGARVGYGCTFCQCWELQWRVLCLAAVHEQTAKQPFTYSRRALTSRHGIVSKKVAVRGTLYCVCTAASPHHQVYRALNKTLQVRKAVTRDMSRQRWLAQVGTEASFSRSAVPYTSLNRHPSIRSRTEEEGAGEGGGN